MSAEEQAVYKKLSAFAGGFTLEAALQVAGATVETLANLVAHSLVRQWNVEISNIHLAWSSAVEQERAQGLLKIHMGLGERYKTSGRYGEGLELFQQGAARRYPIYQEGKGIFSAGHSARDLARRRRFDNGLFFIMEL